MSSHSQQSFYPRKCAIANANISKCITSSSSALEPWLHAKSPTRRSHHQSSFTMTATRHRERYFLGWQEPGSGLDHVNRGKLAGPSDDGSLLQ